MMKFICILLEKVSIIKFIKVIIYRVSLLFKFIFDKLFSFTCFIEKKIYGLKKKFFGVFNKLTIKHLIKKYKNVIIFNHYRFPWEDLLYQRPQHLAMGLGKDKNTIVFYCTNHEKDYCLLNRKVGKNVYLTNEFDYLIRCKGINKILYSFSTNGFLNYEDIKKYSKNMKIIYDYVDEFSLIKHLNNYDMLLRNHVKILKDESIIVLCTAQKIYDDAKKYRKRNLYMVSNGCSVNDFNKEIKKIPSSLRSIKANFKKVILYYGALFDWFDYDLLKKCASAYKDYAFVLIGLLQTSSILDENSINEYDNIFYLGTKKYKDLYKYSKSADLLIVPFIINDITISCNPIKIFEYMAVKRPILTTNMPECKKYSSVVVANNSDEFIKLLPKTIEKKYDKKYLNNELKEAKQNSWDAKAKDIMDLLKL